MAGIFLESQQQNPYSQLTLEGDPEWKKKQFPSKPGSGASALSGQLDIPLLNRGILNAIKDPAFAVPLASEAGLTFGYEPDQVPAKKTGPGVQAKPNLVTNQPSPASPAVVNQGQGVSAPAKANLPVTEEQPHPATGSLDPWDYASKLPDKEFKRFVDMNQDSPGFQGFGYIEAKDPKTGKMKLERIIDRPQTSQGGQGGVGGSGIGDMTLREAQVLGPILNAAASREDNALYRQGLLDQRKSEDATRKAIADATLSQEKRNDFQRKLDTFAPTVGVDEANKPVKAYDIGLLDMMDSGQKFKADDPSFYPAAESLWNRRESWIVNQFKKLNVKYDNRSINDPKSETYKHRSALINTYRNEMMKKYGGGQPSE